MRTVVLAILNSNLLYRVPSMLATAELMQRVEVIKMLGMMAKSLKILGFCPTHS